MAIADKAALRAKIRDILTEDDVSVLPDSYIDDAILETEQELNTGEFGIAKETLRVLEMIAVEYAEPFEGEAFVTLPDGFLGLRYLKDTNSNTVPRIEYRAPDDFVSVRDQGTDIWIYTISNVQKVKDGQIVSVPQLRVKASVPDGTRLEAGYYAEISPLKEDTDTNWLLQKKQNIYIYGALYFLSDVLQDLNTDGRADRYFAKFQKGVLGMIRTDKRKSTKQGSIAYGNWQATA